MGTTRKALFFLQVESKFAFAETSIINKVPLGVTLGALELIQAVQATSWAVHTLVILHKVGCFTVKALG